MGEKRATRSKEGGKEGGRAKMRKKTGKEART